MLRRFVRCRARVPTFDTHLHPVFSFSSERSPPPPPPDRAYILIPPHRVVNFLSAHQSRWPTLCSLRIRSRHNCSLISSSPAITFISSPQVASPRSSHAPPLSSHLLKSHHHVRLVSPSRTTTFVSPRHHFRPVSPSRTTTFVSPHHHFRLVSPQVAPPLRLTAPPLSSHLLKSHRNFSLVAPSRVRLTHQAAPSFRLSTSSRASLSSCRSSPRQHFRLLTSRRRTTTTFVSPKPSSSQLSSHLLKPVPSLFSLVASNRVAVSSHRLKPHRHFSSRCTKPYRHFVSPRRIATSLSSRHNCRHIFSSRAPACPLVAPNRATTFVSSHRTALQIIVSDSQVAPPLLSHRTQPRHPLRCTTAKSRRQRLSSR
jgi:hypothetical protein